MQRGEPIEPRTNLLTRIAHRTAEKSPTSAQCPGRGRCECAPQLSVSNGGMQHSNRSHTEQATHNTDDSEEIISREEGPARKD
jgi:hypothetical protein